MTIRKPSRRSLFGWFRVGAADQVGADEPDTATGALWRTLSRDRLAIAALAVLAACVALDALALAVADLGFLAQVADLARPLLAVAVVKAGLSRVIHREERRFWNEVAAAFALWFLALAWLTFIPDRPAATYTLGDVFYAASFLVLVIAVERPMRRRQGLYAADMGVTLTWSGGAVFVLGLLFYFILIPVVFDLPARNQRLLSFYMYLVLDLYVAAKLIYAGRIAQSRRWNLLYSLLALMMMAVFVDDLADCLTAAGALSPPWPAVADFAWNVPYLFLVLAARLRHHPFPSAESVFDSVSRKAPLPWPRERLVGYALLFPLIHFTFHFMGLLDPSSQSVREGFMLIWLLLFGALAIVQQRVMESKARYLWMERMRAEEALHRSEESLRLVRERREAEEALRQSEEKFNKAFRSIPDAMLISTLADGRILEVNDSFEQQFGYHRDEVLGKTGVELRLWVEPEDRAIMTRLLRERGMVRNLKFELTKKSGERRLTLLSGEVIDLDGESCLVMVLRDITDTGKKLLDSLQSALSPSSS